MKPGATDGIECRGMRGRDLVWCALVASCGVDAGAEHVKVATRTTAAHLRVDDTRGKALASVHVPLLE